VTVETDGGNRWQRLQPRERALIILFGLIGVLALVYLLLFSSSGEPEAFPTTRPRPTRTATPRPSATPTPTGVPETNDFFEGKDPFRPLVGESPGPAPTGTPSTGGPASGNGQHVTLVDISGSGGDRTATVQVNGQEYTVQVGDTFAESYRVKSLTATCGTFLFGDEQFTLCEGQEVFK